MREVLLECLDVEKYNRVTRYRDIDLVKWVTIETQQHENATQVGHELTIVEHDGVNHRPIAALFGVNGPHRVFAELDDF